MPYQETHNHEINETERKEKRFYEIMEQLDSVTRKTPAFKKIFDEIEDSEDYTDGLKKLEIFIRRRTEVLDTVSISHQEGYRVDMESARYIVQDIRLAASNPESFLGNGATAEVYTLKSLSLPQWLCVKIIQNNERYIEGNPIQKEIRFLDELQSVIVEGVRTPSPFFMFSGIDIKGIVMEQLDAFNFRRIIEGQTTEGIKDELPKNFDANDFFRRLRAYVNEMHKKGIFHGDLHLRNLMIDRQTGLPYIIDFGKAKWTHELDRTKINTEEYKEKDLHSIYLAEIEVKKWLKRKT